MCVETKPDCLYEVWLWSLTFYEYLINKTWLSCYHLVNFLPLQRYDSTFWNAQGSLLQGYAWQNHCKHLPFSPFPSSQYSWLTCSFWIFAGGGGVGCSFLENKGHLLNIKSSKFSTIKRPHDVFHCCHFAETLIFFPIPVRSLWTASPERRPFGLIDSPSTTH